MEVIVRTGVKSIQLIESLIPIVIRNECVFHHRLMHLF